MLQCPLSAPVNSSASREVKTAPRQMGKVKVKAVFSRDELEHLPVEVRKTLCIRFSINFKRRFDVHLGMNVLIN